MEAGGFCTSRLAVPAGSERGRTRTNPDGGAQAIATSLIVKQVA